MQLHRVEDAAVTGRPAAVLSEIYGPIQEDLAAVEGNLRGLAVSADSSVSETIPQILKAGGKRMRPALLLVSARACEYAGGDKAVALATAIELIHTASLIHDDVIDNDSLRRGIPTINAIKGDTVSVIIGDYLYSQAFAILAQSGDMDLVRCVASATNLMAQGDLRQLRTQGDTELTEDIYLSIIADKTASLFSCSCRVGAMLGRNHDGEVSVLTRYGQNLGMAFQIIDDLLDLTADQGLLGKPLGNDIRQGKLTLPLIHAMRVADRKDREWIEHTVRSGSMDEAILVRVLEILNEYDGIGYSMKKALEYGGACKEELYSLRSAEGQTALASFADYVVQRAY